MARIHDSDIRAHLWREFHVRDDILMHIRKIGPAVRMLIVGVLGFIAAELLYGSRGPDTGVVQFILYGLVGCVPATLSSWLAHKYAEEPQPVTSS